MMTPEERTLVKQLIEKVNRLEKRLGLQETIEVSGGGSTDVAAAIHAAANKATPINSDEFGIVDSGAGNVLKNVTWANVKATMQTFYDSVATSLTNKTLGSTNISALTGKTTPIDVDSVVIVDSAAADVFKAVTGTNWKAYMKTYFDTLYVLLAGKSGGQTINGGTGSGENLTLVSTAHATKGKIILGGAGVSAYDGVNDRLGIGADDPVGEIEAISTSTSNATRGLTSSQHNSGAQSAVMSFRKSRNTRASQTTVANGDFIGDFIFQPYDGTNYLRTAQIAAKAVGTVTTASVPTDLLFAAGATDDASLTNVRMTIKSTGAVGIGVTGPAAQLDILQATLGTAVQQLASTATNDDPTEIIYQNRVATTDATVTSLHVFTLAQNTTYTFDVWVTARRTAGTGVGAANDGAGVHMNGTYKGMTGTATIVGTLTVVSSNLNTSIAAVTMDVTGATVRVRVTGTLNNTITFHMTARVNLVAS